MTIVPIGEVAALRCAGRSKIPRLSIPDVLAGSRPKHPPQGGCGGRRRRGDRSISFCLYLVSSHRVEASIARPPLLSSLLKKGPSKSLQINRFGETITGGLSPGTMQLLVV